MKGFYTATDKPLIRQIAMATPGQILNSSLFAPLTFYIFEVISNYTESIFKSEPQIKSFLSLIIACEYGL